MKKIYKFYATWCPPCKSLTEVLKTVESPVLIEDIDIDHNKELAQKYSIQGVPTLVMIDGDSEVKRISGRMTAEEFLKWVI